MKGVIYEIPADDKGWLDGAVSATLTTRRTLYFSDPMGGAGDREGAGALAQKLQRKTRNTKIDEARVCKMRALGVGVATIARQLGVGANSIYRVLRRAKARADG